MHARVTELDRQIVGLLQRDGPLSTRQIAERLEVDRGRVYRRCRKLRERTELLRAQQGRSDRPVFLFPVTGEVVTKGSRDRIDALVQDLDDLVWRYAQRGKSLTDPEKKKLRTALLDRVRSLEPDEEQMERFVERIDEIAGHTGGSHFRAAYAPTPYYPACTYWSLAGDPTTLLDLDDVSGRGRGAASIGDPTTPIEI